MNNIDLILDIVKDIRSTIHDFQKQQNKINSRVTKVEATIKDMEHKLSSHESKIEKLSDKDKKAQGIALLIGFAIPIVIGILGIIF